MPVPAAVALAPAALGLLSNVGQFIGAHSKLKDAESEMSKLSQPYYKVQSEYYQNRNNAAESAQGGLTQTSKDFYTDTVGRGLGTSLEAIDATGGNPNDIAKIFDTYSQGMHRLASADSEKQIDNIRYFNQANKDLAGQKTIQWGVNEYQPYQNKMKELTERVGAERQNQFNAIQGGIGAVQAGATALQNQSLMGKLGMGEGTVPGDLSSTSAGLLGNMPLSTMSNGVTPNPTSTYRNMPDNFQAMQFKQYLDSLPEDERQMLLQGHY